MSRFGGLSLAGFADLDRATQPYRQKAVEETLARTDYVGHRFFEGAPSRAGIKEVENEIRLTDKEALRLPLYGTYAPRFTTIRVLTRNRPARLINDISYDELEKAMAEGPDSVRDHMGAKESEMVEGTLKTLDAHLFARVESPADLIERILGPSYYAPVQINTTLPLGGFECRTLNYADGSTANTVIADVDRSLAANNRAVPWFGTFTEINDAFFDLWTATRSACNFRSQPGIPVGARVTTVYCPDQWVDALVNRRRKGPDDWNNDEYKGDADPRLLGLNFMRAPVLNSVAGLPIYIVRKDKWTILKEKGSWMTKKEPRYASDRPTVIVTPAITRGVAHCKNPREGIALLQNPVAAV